MTLLALAQLPARAGGVWSPDEIVAAVTTVSTGAVVVLLMFRWVRRVRWPRPFRPSFALLHLAAVPAWALVWLALWFLVANAVALLFIGRPHADTSSEGWPIFLVVGAFLYAVVGGITYSVEATARAARAEAAAARAQLAALRGQLHPHFLFNALHTVVQLIPADPRRAAEAAELVASLLRTAVEEERDEVSLDEEWSFVSRYLEVERIRFGDRLRVRAEVEPALFDERIPSFALQTLVENSVRHGAAHRVAPTEIVVAASSTDAGLTLSVWNAAPPPPRGPVDSEAGTGLARLRERLTFLYGDAARLTCGARDDGGFRAVLVVPRSRRRG